MRNMRREMWISESFIKIQPILNSRIKYYSTLEPTTNFINWAQN